MLCTKKRELNLPLPKIIISTVQFLKEKGNPDKIKIPERLIDDFQGFDVCFKSYYAMHWPIMNVNEDLFKIIKYPQKNSYCDHVMNTITIRADGTVVPCCYDLTTGFPMGNVIANSLEDIWNNEKYLQIRKSIYEGGDNNLCKNCATIKSSSYLSFKNSE